MNLISFILKNISHSLHFQFGHANTPDRAQIIDIYDVSNSSNSPIGEKIKRTMDAVNETKETRTVDRLLTSKGSTVMAVVIASGQMKDSIDRIIRGENIGTLFVAKSSLSSTQLNYVQ